MLGILSCSIIFSVILSNFYLTLCLSSAVQSQCINYNVHTGSWYSKIFRYCLAWMWTALKRKTIPWELHASASNLSSHALATHSLYLGGEQNANWRKRSLMQEAVVLFFFPSGRKSLVLSTRSCAATPPHRTGWWVGAGESREVRQGASGPAFFWHFGVHPSLFQNYKTRQSRVIIFSANPK